jgi:hypothetical protein
MVDPLPSETERFGWNGPVLVLETLATFLLETLLVRKERPYNNHRVPGAESDISRSSLSLGHVEP